MFTLVEENKEQPQQPQTVPQSESSDSDDDKENRAIDNYEEEASKVKHLIKNQLKFSPDTVKIQGQDHSDKIKVLPGEGSSLYPRQFVIYWRLFVDVKEE